MKKFLIIIILLQIFASVFAQTPIKINEASSRNDQAIFDEDGEDSDWIEILNEGTDTIELNDYYLSDDKDNPFMWRFPKMSILPGEYIVVFASAKDRRKTINHWETPLNGDSLWKYLNPTEQSSYDYLNWSEPEFNDEDWEWKRGAFGTGYENIQTVSNDTLCCIYLRNEFNLSDTSQVLAMSIHAFYDDGFTVFLNGYEILRQNMLHNGVKPAYNTPAFPKHTSEIDSGETPSRFDIDSKLWKNLIRSGKNVLAIQNHDQWNNRLVIKPWLSIAMADSNIQTREYANELSKAPLPLHTNFKINAEGEKIYLFDKYGKQIHKLEIPHLKSDISFGYHPQFEDSLVLFSEPSPGNVNNNNAFPDYVPDTCDMLSGSGFYSDSVLVELLNYDTTYKAYYTLDGSTPTINSYQYHNPFWIDSTVVFRIQFFADTLLPGPVSNFSWFVNDSSKLEVFSIIMNPNDLWDNDYGIYVVGDESWGPPYYFEANFWQDWERHVNIQYFDSENKFNWNQNAGIKIHGNYSRRNPQKSLGFFAKSKYGKSRFNQKLINSKPYLSDFKRFILRNAGNDNKLAHFRDLLIHKRMLGTNVDVQSGRPVNSYINGEYWGIYNLREKIDRYYLEQNQGINPNEVNLLEQNGLIINGDRNSYESLVKYVQNNDLAEDIHYDYVLEQIDIENYIDLYIANFYHINTDWPHHNSKFWNAPGRKWRQILQDLDVSTGMFSRNQYQKNPLPNIHDDSLSYLAIFYKSLLNNDNFKIHYINRFADLMNTIFLPSEYMQIFNALKTEIEPEMPRHCERWNMNYNNWNGFQMNKISDFIDNRSPYMRQFLREKYNLGAYDTINLSVEPQGKGSIKLNTITINENNWQGLYFDSIPVYLEAIPNPGFEFVRWESSTSPNITDSGRILNNYYLKPKDDLTAVFFSETGLEDTLNIAITEINYREWKNAITGDWIEIFNRESDTIDLSNWKLNGLKPYKGWELPSGTKIAPNEYLVLVQDTVSFTKWHKNVNFIGPFQFDLEENEIEELKLYDELDRLVSKISFSQKTPWPNNFESAKTIELIDSNSDYQQAENWQLGCPGGSPGFAPQDCQQEYPLVITEINYNSRSDYETGDWIELFNNGDETIQLSHWMIQDENPDNKKQLPLDFSINSGERIILLQDTSLFFNVYGADGKWFGPLNFGLSAQGEIIKLYNPFGLEIINFNYSDQSPWPEDAGNNGKSIELSNPSANMHLGENWIANCFLGTPWKNPNWCVQSNSIWISEVKYQSAPDSISGDWIELYNSNSRSVELLDWKIVLQGDTLAIDTSLYIEATDYMVLISDSLQFYSVYDTSLRTTEIGSFDLRKEEEAIAIIDPYRNPGQILNYHYLLSWPVFQTDTNNRTLELVDYSNTYLPENWRASCDFGTPGLPPSYCNTDGIEAIENLLDFMVKPNPTFNDIQIEIQIDEPDKFQISIIDYQGNLIYNKNHNLSYSGKNTISIDLQHLTSGIYLLQIIGDNKSGQTKILKIEE